MTRDEVLRWLDEFAACYEGEIRECKSDWLKISYHQRSLALRAASELIRAGGWRPIAEAPPKLNWALCGRWNGQIWEEVESSPKECAELGWTHYFVVPAPPAREVPNERG